MVQNNSPKNSPRNAPKNSPRVQCSSPYVTLYLFCNIIVIYTHLNPINLWNRPINIFNFIINSFIFTIRHNSRLFGYYSDFITGHFCCKARHRTPFDTKFKGMVLNTIILLSIAVTYKDKWGKYFPPIIRGGKLVHFGTLEIYRNALVI